MVLVRFQRRSSVMGSYYLWCNSRSDNTLGFHIDDAPFPIKLDSCVKQWSMLWIFFVSVPRCPLECTWQIVRRYLYNSDDNHSGSDWYERDDWANLDWMYQNLGDTHFVSCDCHSGAYKKRIQVESGRKRNSSRTCQCLKQFARLDALRCQCSQHR